MMAQYHLAADCAKWKLRGDSILVMFWGTLDNLDFVATLEMDSTRPTMKQHRATAPWAEALIFNVEIWCPPPATQLRNPVNPSHLWQSGKIQVKLN